MSVYSINGKEPINAWIPSLDTAGNGTTTLNDLVGSKNGTLNNMDPVTDWVADTGSGGVRALDFDATDDYVQIADTAQWHQSDFTISAWAFFAGAGEVNYGTVLSRDNGGVNWFFLSRDALSFSGKLSANFYDGVNNPRVISAAAISLSAWTHIGCTVSGNTCTLYLAGVSVGSGSIATWTRPAINNQQLGRWNIAGGRTMDGRLDDIRLWNQALNATDVSALFTNGRGGVAVSGESRRRRQSVSGGVL